MVSNSVISSGCFAVGSIIPGGRVVVNSPDFIQSTTALDRSIILPDITGKLLFNNDGTTDFSSEIAGALNSDGNFNFVGISFYAGDSCKEDLCNHKHQCAPIGYPDAQSKMNFYPVHTVCDVLEQGVGSVYAESEFTTSDLPHVRVKVIDEDVYPHQLIGGITRTPDDGTQPLTNGSIVRGCSAGSSVMLKLK